MTLDQELRDMIDHADSRAAAKMAEIHRGLRCPVCDRPKQSGTTCDHGSTRRWEYGVRSHDGLFMWFPTEYQAKAFIEGQRVRAAALQLVHRKGE